MATTTRAAARPRRLTDRQLLELMDLVKGADSVELKVTIPSDSHRATLRGLPIDPVEAEPRQVFFFDTPDLRLNKAGIVVRARRRPGGVGDTVVKLRPIVPSDLSPELRKNPAFNVEVDAIPGGFVCSASFKDRISSGDIRDAVAGKLPIRKIFGKEQRAFFASRAPEDVSLDDLAVLGPTFILKAVWTPDFLKRRMVAELWLYPDGSRILELSTKCLPSETFQVAAEARGYLADAGIKVAGVQQTKTKTALEFFANQLRSGGDEGSA